jgi:hypothetical protein
MAAHLSWKSVKHGIIFFFLQPLFKNLKSVFKSFISAADIFWSFLRKPYE